MKVETVILGPDTDQYKGKGQAVTSISHIAAVSKKMESIGFDAVKHLVLCQVEKRPPRLDLDVYPYLPRANVAATSAASYMCLMAGGAS